MYQENIFYWTLPSKDVVFCCTVVGSFSIVYNINVWTRFVSSRPGQSINPYGLANRNVSYLRRRDYLGELRLRSVDGLLDGAHTLFQRQVPARGTGEPFLLLLRCFSFEWYTSPIRRKSYPCASIYNHVIATSKEA